MSCLINKVVVITGGAEGIGYAIADKFLQHGTKIVILLDFNDALGLTAAKTLRSKYGDNKEVIFIKCDVVTDFEEVSKKILDNFKVDVLVNNAGISNDSVASKIIDTNLTAVTQWGLKFWEHMSKHKSGEGGTIINIASIYGFRVTALMPLYNASKFGVMGFSRSLGHVTNYEKSGVRVLALCPGFTKTNLKAASFWHEGHLGKAFEELLKDVEFQEPDDVGNAAVEIYKNAKTGTAWLIENSSPVVEVPV